LIKQLGVKWPDFGQPHEPPRRLGRLFHQFGPQQRRREMAQAAGLNPDVVEGMYKLLVDNFIQEEMDLLRQRKNEN